MINVVVIKLSILVLNNQIKPVALVLTGLTAYAYRPRRDPLHGDVTFGHFLRLVAARSHECMCIAVIESVSLFINASDYSS